MDVLFLILDWVLDGIIVGGFTVAGAMPFVALIAALRENLTRDLKARERRRRYRDLLKRTIGTTLEERKDWQILRKSHRQRVFLGARVVLSASRSTLDATIIDLSATGARLAFGRIVDLSRGSELDIELLKTGERVRARVAWATETQCGVAFTSTPQATAPFLTSAAEVTRAAA